MFEYEAVVCSDGETEEMKLNVRPYPVPDFILGIITKL